MKPTAVLPLGGTDAGIERVSSRQLLYRVGAYQIRVAVASAAVFAALLPLLVVITFAFNRFWDAHLDTGADPTAKALLVDAAAAIDSRDRVFAVVESLVLAVCSPLLIGLWLRLVARASGGRVRAGWRPWLAVAAAVAVGVGTVVRFVVSPFEGSPTVFVLLAVFAPSLAASQCKGARKRGLVRHVAALSVAMAVVMAVLGYWLLTAVLTGSDSTRLLLRLFAFPLLQEVWVATARLRSWKIGAAVEADPGATADLFCAYAGLPLLTMSLIGRVLALTMRSSGGVVGMLLGITGMEVLLRSTVRRRDAWYMGREAASGAAARRLRADLRGVEDAVECIAILLAGALALLLRVTWDGSAPDPAVVVALAVLQLLLECVAGLLPALLVWACPPELEKLARRVEQRWVDVTTGFTAKRFADPLLGGCLAAAAVAATTIAASLSFFPGAFVCASEANGRGWYKFGPCQQ